MFPRSFHLLIHFICLTAVAFFMPVSVWMVSLFSITGLANWILSGDLLPKYRILSRRNEMIILFSLFVMYLLWLLNTTDFQYAIRELKLKLPLLFFPIVIGSMPRLTASQMRMLILSFLSGCLIAAGAGYLALIGFWPAEINDSRDLALFVPATRLAVYLNFGIFSALWLALTDTDKTKLFRWVLLFALLALTIFLVRLLNVTSIILFIVLSAGTGIYLLSDKKNRIAGIIISTAASATIVAGVGIMVAAWSGLHVPSHPGANIMKQTTASGNSYMHYPGETLIENGHNVWINICDDELRNMWNSRSEISYDTLDNAGNELKVTLIRYLSFLGETKDSAAVAALAESDVRNIENGFANPLYARPGNPYAKAYELAWQFDRALKGADPTGHSVTQRFEFYRAAAGIIIKYPWLGVGTGDIRQAFIEEYKNNGTPLSNEYRMRSHNQYLTYAVTFGLPGMVLALILMILPWIRSPFKKNYLFVVFIALIFMSMFNDDTFGSFTGTTFFSYFYTLFLMVKNEDDNSK